MTSVMYHTLAGLWIEHLRKGLIEDGQPWDWTTLGILSSQGTQMEAYVLAKSDGTWAAETLTQCLPDVFPGVEAQSLVHDSDKFKKGDKVVRLRGAMSSLLALERPFLNLSAYVSGIATTTQQIVEQVKQYCPSQTPRVSLTRKTLPGYRDLSIHGVRTGGGYPHRVSLSGGILIKENHIEAAGGIEKAVAAARSVAPHGLKIEVEVRNFPELSQALGTQVDGVLLDNFSPQQVRDALGFIRARVQIPWVEVSGGLSLKTIAQYAIPGVDVLSVGALTHSVQCVDLSFLIGE